MVAVCTSPDVVHELNAGAVFALPSSVAVDVYVILDASKLCSLTVIVAVLSQLKYIPFTELLLSYTTDIVGCVLSIVKLVGACDEP